MIASLTEQLFSAVECFRRVNSSGAPMSEVHMLNAIAWSKDFDLRRRFRDIKESMAPLGWADLDEQILVDVLKVTSGLEYHATPDELHGALRTRPELLDQLPDYVSRAVEFLAAACGVFGPLALPYRLQLVLLCEAARRIGGVIGGEIGEELRRWFWKTTFSEFFTGSSSKDVALGVECVRYVAAGDRADMFFEYGPVVRPVARFRANAVRGKAFALLLAKRNPLSTDGNPFDAARTLADLGVGAVSKIIPASDLREGGDGPENRWIVHPRQLKAMRDLLAPSLDPRREEILASHLISREASERYVNDDLRGFLQVRRRDIIALERRFVAEDLGLSYAVSDDTVLPGRAP